MKHSIFILASALAIFIVTLFVTNDYMVDETIDEADRINDLQIKELTQRMELNILIREKAVHSFMSGMFYYDIHEKNGKKDTLIYIAKKDEKKFKNYVFDSLRDFIKLNPHTECAAFIIEPSVYPEKGPHGYVPLVEHGDTTDRNVATNFDFFSSKPYKDAVRTHNCLWYMPPKESPLYGNSIIYYVPIMRQSGGVFGVFAISATLESIRSGLMETLSSYEHDSDILVADNNDNIILSTYRFTEKFNKVSDYATFLKAAEGFHKLNEDSIHHDNVSINGNEYFVYHRNLMSVPWRVIAASDKNLVYKNVTRTRNIILIVATIGMLLMLLCCFVVFRQEKKHLKEKGAAEEELKMAANVQQSMLKSTEFSIGDFSLSAFMRPAREAGGDLYDYQERNGKMLFCIGDVSGKGLPAALFMAQVVSLFRNACNFTDKPNEIVSQMNNVLVENNPCMTFCTFFIGVIDHAKQTLTFCNAGHNRPVVVPSQKPSSSIVHSTSSIVHGPYFLSVKPNIAIGLMPNYPYKAETIDLTVTSRILLYTDGITEAKNAAHDQFGEDKLINAISKVTTSTTAALTSTLISSVESFVNGYEQSDDITVLAIS